MRGDGFVPPSESADWLAGAAYWDRVGREAFTRDQVPHLATNDGVRAAWAADVLFANCAAADRRGELEDAIAVLELGAGLGLHAKLLLDRFRNRCNAERVGYYDRLAFTVSDASPKMVADIERLGTFDAHSGHASLAVVDAMDLAAFSAVRAVFHNYLLDTLPFEVVLRDAGVWHHLQVRGWDSEVEHRYVPVEPTEIPWIEHVDALTHEGEPLAVSHGAVHSILGTLAILRPGGFVLWSDYGGGSMAQFAGSRAMGVNFALVDRIVRASGACVDLPPGDEHATLHARIVHNGADAETVDAFRDAYSQDRIAELDSLRERARDARTEGSLDDAERCFSELHHRCTHGWAILVEWAEFTLYERGDAERALEMVERAAAMNPTGRALVHNVMGDALLALGRDDDATAAFERALEVAPADARAHASRARLLARHGRHDEAVAAARQALVLDGGRHREVLERVLADVEADAAERTS